MLVRGADMAIIKVVDPDSGEVAEFEECEACKGAGGYDASTDCEVYDDWQECEECNGTGRVELGGNERDRFIPERDALTPND